MTDARLKGEWLNMVKFDQLSDVAWRVLCGALMWSAEQGTDGVIPTRYVKRQLHPDGEQPAAYAELEAAGIWAESGDSYVIAGWGDKAGMGQSTAEQVAAYREKAAARQRKHRASQPVTPDPATGDVTRDVTRDVTSDVGKGIGIGKGAFAPPSSIEPSPFCDRHPTGSGGEPCRGCQDAREVRDQWRRDKEARSTPYRIDPATCQHRRHKVENFCVLCQEILEPDPQPAQTSGSITGAEALRRVQAMAESQPSLAALRETPSGLCPVCSLPSDPVNEAFDYVHPDCAVAA